ncbi:MAG: hypothetical protein ACYDG5_00640 [Dehalococcoidales bacterium]
MTRVDVKELSTKFFTRANVTAAFGKLVIPENASMTIELNNVLIFSYIFLDEVIFKVSKAGVLKHIVFNTDDELVLEKLAYIAGTRHVEILVSSTALKRHRITPKTFTRHKPVFVENKENPNKDQSNP